MTEKLSLDNLAGQVDPPLKAGQEGEAHSHMDRTGLPNLLQLNVK